MNLSFNHPLSELRYFIVRSTDMDDTKKEVMLLTLAIRQFQHYERFGRVSRRDRRRLQQHYIRIRTWLDQDLASIRNQPT